MTLQEFERAYEIFRGELAKGRDPKGTPLQVDGLAPKWIAAEDLPEDLRPLYSEGAIEGTMGALFAAFLAHAKSQLATRTYIAYRYFLSAAQMDAARKLRAQSPLKQCSADAGARNNLMVQQQSIRPALPATYSEKLVYSCSTAP